VSGEGEFPVGMDGLKKQISHSSFYLAMRVMPKAEREAMFAVYAFCRLVDDIADDGTRPRPRRAEELEIWRADIHALYAGREGGRAAFLANAVKAFDLSKDDFLAVIDGMEMDVAEDIRAPDMKTLDLYCERVAVAVGRLSTRIFGMELQPGIALAHSLGLALQFTNILRDIDEDAGIGRLYLPQELLGEAGIETTDPVAAIADSRVDTVCRALAAKARDHFLAADNILAARPKGRLLAPRLMAAVYSTILRDMLSEGWKAPRRRISLGKRRLLWIAARCCVFG
jgi:phytoene synthase